MNTTKKAHLQKYSSLAGLDSTASAALLSLSQFSKRTGDDEAGIDTRSAWQTAQAERNDLLILEKNVLTRSCPSLPNLIRQSLKQNASSLLGYEEDFGRSINYANPGDIASVFSPAAYLTAMYREARHLYPLSSRWSIDRRRPDLAALVLSQKNMDTEVASLSLSNEVLMPHARQRLIDGTELAESEFSDDEVMRALAVNMSSSATPWHYHYSTLRQAILQKDPHLHHMLSKPKFTQQVSEALLTGLHFPLSPELRKILTETITEDNAEELYRHYFNNTPPEEFISAKYLKAHYDLDDEELNEFNIIKGIGSYENEAMTTIVNGKFLRINITGYNNNDTLRIYPVSSRIMRVEGTVKFSHAQGYALSPGYTGTNPTIRWTNDRRTYSHNDPFNITLDLTDANGANINSTFKLSGEDSLRVGKWWTYQSPPHDGEFHTVKWNITPLGSALVYALKVNKAIRLYKATGFSPRMLEQTAESLSTELLITDETLALISQTKVLMARYLISHESALVMAKGLISLKSEGNTLSQWDRLFNSPALTEANFTPSPSGRPISLLPENAEQDSEIKAALKRAMQTDDYGLYCLKVIYHKGDKNVNLPLVIEHISGMYALSLWCRCHNLTPAELLELVNIIDLPENMARCSTAEWHQLLDTLYATLQWMEQNRLSLNELMLMTRSESDITGGPEIINFLEQLREYILESEETTPEEQIDRLIPYISGAFNLTSDQAVKALLLWVNKAKPGGWTLENLWSHLASGNDTAHTNAVAFACGLAQMVFIYRKSTVPVDALMLFIEAPYLLGPSATLHNDNVLNRNLYTVRTLYEFSNWIRTLPTAGEALNVLITALPDQGITATQLAKITGESEILVTQAIRRASHHSESINENRVISYACIDKINQWLSLSKTFGVTPEVLSELLSLDYTAETSVEWQKWQQTARAFSANLTQSQEKAAKGKVEEELSAALCGVLLTDYSEFSNIQDREQLYQYLLADNLNSAQVVTSRIAEAITALQTFIHRSLTVPESADAMLRDGPGRQFFREWNRWNSRYSNWAAYRKLMYFPENYIDPTMRLGQTPMMDEMLQSLGQAQINEDTVGDAFMGYLTSFEEVANLTTLCAYHDNPAPQHGKTYFIGHNQSGTREYWWRAADEDKRDETTGKLPANAWTGWEKISCSPQVWNNCIRPVVYKSRLYLIWMEREFTPVSDASGKSIEKWRWLLKLSALRYDGNWNEPVIKDVSANLEKFNTTTDKINLYAAVWLPTDSMLIAVYNLHNPSSGDKSVGWTVSSALNFAPYDNINGSLELLKQSGQLVTTAVNPVINQFTGSQVISTKEWVSTGALPPSFDDYDLALQSVAVINKESDKQYDLNINISAKMKLNADANIFKEMELFIKYMPEIKDIQKEAILTKYTFASLNISLSALSVPANNSTTQYTTYVMGHIKNVTSTFRKGAALYFYLYDENAITPFQRIFIHVNTGSDVFFYQKNERTSSIENVTAFHVKSEATPPFKDVKFDITGKSILNNITPSSFSLSKKIEKNNIEIYFDNKIVNASSDWMTDDPWFESFNITLQNQSVDMWEGNSHDHRVTLRISNSDDKGSSFSRLYKVRVSRPGKDTIPVTLNSNPTNHVQYMQYGANLDKLTRLNTLFAHQLTERATSGIGNILSWETQQIVEPPMIGNAVQLMDFAGANAIYFWELFYYTPMLIMQRFLQEERFELAEHWLQYVFNPGGYMEGLKRGNRLWNVRPLEEDTSWNSAPLESYDPDAVAQNDPMHYKLNAFMRLLDIIIGRGDMAYRKLERDTLSEAKVYYSRALNMLGARPSIEHNIGWNNPALKEAADESRQIVHLNMLSALRDEDVQPPQRLSSGNESGELFSMEVNEIMLSYWDTLKLRLFNLRHNLTIDGKPLNLPLYAASTDPKALLAAAIMAETGGERGLPTIESIPALRFTALLATARTMVSQLIQFGNSLQLVLRYHDGAEVAQLLSQQGAELASSSLALQNQTLNELAAERTTIEKQLDMITARRDHYQRLYDENINQNEIGGLALLNTAQMARIGVKALYLSAGLIKTSPKIFGLANGGMEYAGPINAAGQIIELAASTFEAGSHRVMIEEQFRRRRQEWHIQKLTSMKEIEMLKAQLAALDIRVTSTQMHITQMEMQAAQANAHMTLLFSQFTCQSLYSWMRSRLATIFYQYYDLTVSCCLMAQKALQWEKNDSTLYLRTGTWNGAWAGLLSGDSLMLSLAQMEMAWLTHQKREMEITRKISLKQFFENRLGEDANGMQQAIQKLLIAGQGEFGAGNGKIALNNSLLTLHFSLSDFSLTQDFPNKNCRIRSIAVSLPDVAESGQHIRGQLYTNISETQLPAGCYETAISHAIQDNGLFSGSDVTNRWMPFEGLSASDDSGMTLSFADALGEQQTLLNNLSDVILHIQFTAR